MRSVLLAETGCVDFEEARLTSNFCEVNRRLRSLARYDCRTSFFIRVHPKIRCGAAGGKR